MQPRRHRGTEKRKTEREGISSLLCDLCASAVNTLALGLVGLLAAGMLLGCEGDNLGGTLTVRSSSVVGKVTLEGRPVENVSVRIEGTPLQSRSNGSGTFRIDLAPPGERVLDSELTDAAGESFRSRVKIEPVAGVVLDVGKVALDRAGAVSGTVTLEGRSVHMGTDVFVPGTSVWTRTAADGGFVLSKLPPGMYRLAFLAAGFRIHELAAVDVFPGETTPIEAVQLRAAGDGVPMGAVTGRVHSAVGRPLERAIVDMIPPLQSSITGEDGGYYFGGLQPTDYLVVAALEGKISNGAKAEVKRDETATAHIGLLAQPDEDKPGRGGWNRPPEVTLACPASAQAGVPVEIGARALDLDGDALAFDRPIVSGGVVSISQAPGDCSSDEGGICAGIDWIPPDKAGLETISISVSDGRLVGRAECPVPVVVASSSENACPLVALTGSTRALAGGNVTLIAAAVDVDGDLLSVEWAAGGGRFSRNRGERVVWTAPREVGEYDLSACVSDGRCPKTCAAVRMEVLAEAEKKVFPSCAVVGPTMAVAGEGVGLRAVTFDPNAFPVKVGWSATSGRISIEQGAATTWTAPQEPGGYAITAESTALSGSVTTCQIGIVVAGKAEVGSCPRLVSTGTSSTVETIPVRVEFKAEKTDPSRADFHLECDTPNGFFQEYSIADDEASFQWIPLFQGVETFTCNADDGRCVSRRIHAVSVTEKKDDLPPFAALSCVEDELLAGQSTLCIGIGKDPEDQNVTLGWSASGGTLSALSGENVTWTAPPFGGEYSITLSASDGTHQARASQVLRVESPSPSSIGMPAGAGEYDCDPGTIALYHFNETQGGSAQDACGSNHAAVEGAVAGEAGKLEKGYFFDGSDDLVEVPSGAVSGLVNGTIEAWVKLKDTMRDYDLIYREREEGDWDVRVQYSARRQAWSMTLNNDGTGARYGLGANSATDFGWHHLALTWDGTVWSLYQDGLLGIVQPDVHALERSDLPMWIGRSNERIEEPLHGWVDEVRISSRARDPEEFRVFGEPVEIVWTGKSAMPTARSDAGVVRVDGNFYVIGGRTADTEASAKNEVLAALEDSWTTEKEMPTARWAAAVARVGRRVHVMGGTGFKEKYEAMSTHEVYDTEEDNWSNRARWPRPRFGASAAAIGGTIHMVGGATEFGGAGDVAMNDRYDASADRWEERAPMLTARARAAVAVRGGALYVIGGKGGEGYLDVVERYDPAADTWSALASMPTARMSAAAVLLNDFIYVIGGEIDSPLKAVEAYDPVRNTWTSLEDMDDPITRFAAGTFQRLTFLIGGHDGVSYLSRASQGFLLPPRP